MTSFRIVYHEAVVADDIPRLSSRMRDRMKRAIEEKIAIHPEEFGVPLRRSLSGYRKLRVGDYRVIFRIEKEIIKIFVIAHRSVVYSRRFSKRVF